MLWTRIITEERGSFLGFVMYTSTPQRYLTYGMDQYKWYEEVSDPRPRSAGRCFPPLPSARTKNRLSLILFTNPDCKTIPFSKNATQLNRNKSRSGSLWLITQWSWKWLLLSANILNSILGSRIIFFLSFCFLSVSAGTIPRTILELWGRLEGLFLQ